MKSRTRIDLLDEIDRVMLPVLMEDAPITIETQARARMEHDFRPRPVSYWRELGSGILIFLAIAGSIVVPTAIIVALLSLIPCR